MDKELQTLLWSTETGKQLSEYHIKLLQKQNINTAEEFVDAENVDKILALGSDTTEEIKRELLNLLVVKVKLKTLYQPNPITYSTGIEELDNFLDSIDQPFRPGRVWEIIGNSDVGKTELMHTIALNFVCKHEDSRVLFVDTNSAFEIERLEQILLHRQLDAECAEKLLDQINVVKAISAQSLIAALESLREQLSNPNAKFKPVSQIKVVLIDSLTAVYFMLRSSCNRNKGRSFLTELAMIMRELAVQHGIAFLVGNMTFIQYDECDETDDDADDTEDALTQPESEALHDDCTHLGEYWCSVCTLTLALELPDASLCDGLRLLKVLSNSCGNNEGSCVLRITDAGVI